MMDNLAMGKKKITTEMGLAALQLETFDLALAVRYVLQILEEKSPGGTVEVRVPPYGAIQCIGGMDHRRGTPPNVVELDGETLLGLAKGQVDFATATQEGKVFLSGLRAGEISSLFPCLIEA